MSIFIVIMIAISLSMDAFSLSLAYGTLGLSTKDISLLSIIVGVYHFFMPLIGMYLGNMLLKFIPISPDFVVFIVLTVIGIQMIVSSLKEEKEVKWMSFIELFSFGLAVSLDSFSVGLGLKAIYPIPLVCSIIFMLTSYSFTYLGLKLGKKLNDKLGNISTRIGGIMLMIIALLYILT
jgi:putative Mn2+ efflux pump MntP